MSRSRLLIWALAVLVVGYVGASSLPSGAEMLSGARSTESRAAELREKIARADGALGDASGFAERLARARVAVPVDAGLSSVIASLDEVVAASGFEWSSASPSSEPSTLGDGQSWSMGLTLLGDPSDLPVLLRAFSELDRLVVVDSVQVRGAEPAVVSLSVRFFTADGSPASFAADAAAPSGGNATNPAVSGDDAPASDGGS